MIDALDVGSLWQNVCFYFFLMILAWVAYGVSGAQGGEQEDIKL